MYGSVTLYKLIVVVLALAWLLRCKLLGRSLPRSLRGSAVLLALLGLALVGYFNFGRFHAGPYFHTAEFFHYYLGARYFEEVGYDGLYAAAVQADRESAAPAFAHVETVRDLHSAEPVPISRVRGDASYRNRFSDDRWAAFRSDLAFFVPHSNRDTWAQTLNDHGYNAPPTLTLILRPLTAALGPAGSVSIHALALLDLLLLGAVVGVVGRVYGAGVAALLGIVVATDLSGFDWIGGALLRYEWFVLSALGIVALERRRFASAGFLLGAAALLRLFPLFLAAGVLLRAGWLLLRTRRLPPGTLSFASGLALSAGLMIGASLLFVGGIETWQAYAHKIGVQALPHYANSVGLRGLAASEVALLLGQLALIALTLVSLPRATAAQAAILGVVAIYALSSLASYYYCVLALCLLWSAPHADADPASGSRADPLAQRLVFAVLGVQALTLGARLVSGAPLPLYDPRVYVATSAGVLALCALLFAGLLRAPRRRNG